MKQTLALSSILLCLSAGCLSDADDSDVGSDFELDDGVSYRMSLNRMSLNALGVGAFSQLGFELAAQPFGQNQASATLAADPDGFELLRYAARCAFDPGYEFIIKDINGAKKSISPPSNVGVGLFPKWTTRALTTTESRWLVACLLAHVNAYGKEVPLSLRGDHAALATSPVEEADYPLFEGAFYGELSHTGEEMLYACYGVDLLAACSGDVAAATATLWGRVCARGGCGNFTIVGQCSDYDGSEIYACATDSNGLVSDCFSEASTSRDKWPSTAELYASPVMNSYLKHIECEG